MYNPKTSTVYAIEGTGDSRVFRIAYDNGNWQRLTFEVYDQLRPITNSKRMVEKGWDAHVYWELPYGEGYDFRKWLQANYGRPGTLGRSMSFTVGNVTIYGYATHNEVNEPYLDCAAPIKRDILNQICDLLMKEYLDVRKQENLYEEHNL